MACRNCDPNYFTLTVYQEKDGNILLHEAEHSPAMDLLWARITKAVNHHSCTDDPRVIELVEAVTRVCDVMKQQQKSPIKKSDKYLSVYYRACLENAERFIRTALAAVRLK